MKKQMMEESLPHMPRKGKNSAAGKLNIPLSTEIVIVFTVFLHRSRLCVHAFISMCICMHLSVFSCM